MDSSFLTLFNFSAIFPKLVAQYNNAFYKQLLVKSSNNARISFSTIQSLHYFDISTPPCFYILSLYSKLTYFTIMTHLCIFNAQFYKLLNFYPAYIYMT